MRYSAFGLLVATDTAIPGLLPASGGSDCDLRLSLDGLPLSVENLTDAEQRLTHVSPYQNERGDPSLRIWAIDGLKLFRFIYEDGVQFIVNRSGTEVWGAWPDSMVAEDAVTYLLGPILGFVLRLRGRVTLHGSAVSIDGTALAFLGPQGGGKSTTAAALAAIGCPVLSDDIVAFGDDLLVQPAYPQLNLWPDSVAALYGTHRILPPLTPNWDKRYLDLTTNGYRFQETPLPLGAIYFLAPRSDHHQRPVIEPISLHDGFMALVENSYGALRIDKTMRAKEFDLLSKIAVQVPLRRVTAPADSSQLARLCDMVLEDSRQLHRI